MLEAKSIDPQQALVLHVGYTAFVGERQYGGGVSQIVRHGGLEYSPVGVFVGVEPSGLKFK